MPGRETVGERVAAIDARFEAFERYTHDRWHKLNNDLTPIVNLPSQMARDMGKMEGRFNGQINAVTREVERSITAAVEKAIGPVAAELADLKSDVETLKAGRAQITGAKMLAVFMVQTIIAALTALGGVLALGHRP